MPQSGRIDDPEHTKLLGTVLTLVVLVLYAWVATSIYAAFLTGAPPLAAARLFPRCRAAVGGADIVHHPLDGAAGPLTVAAAAN